ncbi:MAG: DUF2530 domain-containing protein [Streptosporangiales bacterium]|nr:DUF2530 domain-containing protein [Streptosporangiales bacterium]
MRTDDRVPAALGAVCWAIALVVLLLLGDRVPDPRWLWVCGAGTALGAFGIWYVPRLQRKRAEDEERRARPPA